MKSKAFFSTVAPAFFLTTILSFYAQGLSPQGSKNTVDINGVWVLETDDTCKILATPPTKQIVIIHKGAEFEAKEITKGGKGRTLGKGTMQGDEFKLNQRISNNTKLEWYGRVTRDIEKNTNRYVTQIKGSQPCGQSLTQFRLLRIDPSPFPNQLGDSDYYKFRHQDFINRNSSDKPPD